MNDLPECLVTRRLLLRPPVDRDIPEVVREIGNWNVAKWLGRVPHPYSPCHARTWLRISRQRRDEGSDLVFAIARASKPARLIGVIGCHDISKPDPLFGYWLAERQWGRG